MAADLSTTPSCPCPTSLTHSNIDKSSAWSRGLVELAHLLLLDLLSSVEVHALEDHGAICGPTPLLPLGRLLTSVDVLADGDGREEPEVDTRHARSRPQSLQTVAPSSDLGLRSPQAGFALQWLCPPPGAAASRPNWMPQPIKNARNLCHFFGCQRLFPDAEAGAMFETLPLEPLVPSTPKIASSFGLLSTTCTCSANSSTRTSYAPM